MKLYKIILTSVLIIGLAFIFFNCSKTIKKPPTGTRTDDTTRKKPKEKDPEKQLKCSEIGSGNCGTKCKETCDDLFSRDAEDDCEELSASLVKDFKKIITDTGKGDTDDLNLPALNCLLDLDDQKFVSAIKKMSTRETRKFLKNIAENEELAKIFDEEDDEFNILKQSFKEVISGSISLDKVLKVSIDDNKPFFWLASEEKNEPAFEWFENYVEDHCEDSASDCPGYEEVDALGAYCKVLVDFKDNKLKDFLSETRLFKDRYEGLVEGEDYEYTLSDDAKDFVDYIWDEDLKGDFKDFCRLEIALTDGERKLRSRETQRKYFNTDVCKENMKPADDSGTVKTVAEIWALKNCASNPPYSCIDSSSEQSGFFEDYNDNTVVWEYGNVYGDGSDRTDGTFSEERLKGIGQSFWFLNEDKQIINRFINNHFDIHVKRGNIKAPDPDDPDDPKTSKVRRASFMYYYTEEAGVAKYPDCHRDTGNEDTCLYSYCLVDYELDDDNTPPTVTTCDVLKCALGRPTTIKP